MTTDQPAYADVETLLAAELPEEDVDVPGAGTFRIRSLTRSDVIAVAKMSESKASLDTQERHWLSKGMVKPAMTNHQIEQWQRTASSGVINTVTEAIVALSGGAEGAEKDAYKSDGDELES